VHAVGVKLGPLASNCFSPPRWTDEYPSSKKWSDELERLLAFADSQGQLQKFLPRLHTPRPNQRDEALSELRIAFFLHRNGFPIVVWEPSGLPLRCGAGLAASPRNDRRPIPMFKNLMPRDCIHRLHENALR
jgi:hypothetical protein